MSKSLTPRQQARSRRRRFAAAAAFTAAGLSACSSHPASTHGAVAATVPAIPTPLATSVQTSGGAWATVPMGHLNEPLNTFWQLFFRATGSASWSDKVEATATATNGGLLLASADGRSVVVGVRPTQALTFSPLIATANSGHTWSNGVLAEGLASHPDALATSGDGRVLAVVKGDGGAEVLESAGDLSSWRAVTSVSALAAGAGRACGPTSISAVGFMGENPLVGTACARSGPVGLYAEQAGTWQALGPSLPPAVGHGSVEVLALRPSASGLSALLGLSENGRVRLLVAWEGHPGENWSLSPALQLARLATVTSFGPAGGRGVFVLSSEPSGAELEVATGPASPWRQLPAPPASTATVAFGPTATVQALAVDEGVLTVWSLPPGASSWAKSQVVDVPIPYGSSS